MFTVFFAYLNGLSGQTDAASASATLRVLAAAY